MSGQKPDENVKTTDEVTIPKAELEAVYAKLAALEEKMETPTVSTAPVIISQPMTAAEAAAKEAEAERKKEQEAAEAWLNEKVAVKLFKDGKDYKDPLYVGINGKNLYIQRGVYVKIPRKYQLLIEQSQIQDVKAAEYAEEQAMSYTEAVAANAL